MAFKISSSKLFGFYSNNSTYVRYTTDSKARFYDIIISGGNLIGQTVACALSKNPVFKDLSILLVGSPKEKPFVKSQRSNRVSAIVPTSKKLLEKLGIWQNIPRNQAVTDMKLWGNYSNDFIHITQDEPFYIVENDAIVNSGITENKKAKNLEILFETFVDKVFLNNQNENHKIILKDGRIFETKMLIGSDGAGSLIRKALNTKYLTWDYNQSGIVATLHLSDSESNNSTAWQKFLPEGSIALLPLAPGVSSLVWCTTRKKCEDLLKLPNDIFVDALNEAIQSSPSKNQIIDSITFCAKSIINTISSSKNFSTLAPPYIKQVEENSRAFFPLSFGHSSEYVKSGVALVGDAAHKIHPLAGQGVNIGFRDVKTLEKRLTEGILNGRPLGHINDLCKYETECLRNNVPIMTSIELIHQIYTSKISIIQALGNVGFSFVNSISPVKDLMRKTAST